VNLSHDFQVPGVLDRAYHWRSRGRRCVHCHVSEDHVVIDRCRALVARQAVANSQTEEEEVNAC
jgi:hypothetical protein